MKEDLSALRVVYQTVVGFVLLLRPLLLNGSIVHPAKLAWVDRQAGLQSEGQTGVTQIPEVFKFAFYAKEHKNCILNGGSDEPE